MATETIPDESSYTNPTPEAAERGQGQSHLFTLVVADCSQCRHVAAGELHGHRPGSEQHNGNTLVGVSSVSALSVAPYVRRQPSENEGGFL